MTLKRTLRRADATGMRRSVPSILDERGYTLVELMVTALVLVIGIFGAISLLDNANRTSVANNARMGATNLAREILENARSVDYQLLTPSQLEAAIQTKPGMGGGTPWKLSRRGITYTIEASVCTFDDPKDNVAVTPPADVCTPQAPVAASAPTNLAAETQPDDFRRVTLKLTWDKGTGSRTITQTSLINNPSGGLGPRIVKFESPVLVQFVSGTDATFPTLTTTAESVHWDSDGGPNGSGDSTGGPKIWTTTWNLGAPATPLAPLLTGTIPIQYSTTTVLDGVYVVTAQAFDSRGVAGDSRAAALPLNRSLPITVSGFEAGRNSFQNSVDFRWNANPERDITGYRVYNAGPDYVYGNGNDTLVCSTASASATSCSDTNPPFGPTAYFVVALDRADITNANSVVRESPYGYAVIVAAAGPAPAAPVLDPIVLDPGTGNPQLKWTHPALATVRFFQIYRDQCCGVADRYDSTPTNATSWVDPKPGGQVHRYWVTAVGPTLNESNPSNYADSFLP
jgi:Tfp pilus assembly protein PilV